MEAAGSIVVAVANPLPASVDVKNASISIAIARLVVVVSAIRKIFGDDRKLTYSVYLVSCGALTTSIEGATRANIKKSSSGRAPRKILRILSNVMADELNYYGVGLPEGRSLYSPRGATVLFDCGNQRDLAEDVDEAVQKYVFDHIVKPNPETNRKVWITNGKGGAQSVGPAKVFRV